MPWNSSDSCSLSMYDEHCCFAFLLVGASDRGMPVRGGCKRRNSAADRALPGHVDHQPVQYLGSMAVMGLLFNLYHLWHSKPWIFWPLPGYLGKAAQDRTKHRPLPGNLPTAFERESLSSCAVCAIIACNLPLGDLMFSPTCSFLGCPHRGGGQTYINVGQVDPATKQELVRLKQVQNPGKSQN